MNLPSPPRLLLLGQGRLVPLVGADLARRGLPSMPGVDLGPDPSWTEERFTELLAHTKPDLAAVVLERPYPRLMRELNAALHRRAIPWTTGVLFGTQILIGPAIVPGRTACFACFLHRYEANSPWRKVELPLRAFFDERPEAGLRGSLASVDRFAAGLLAAAVERLWARDEAGFGAFAWYEITDTSYSGHHIVPAPWCPVCSTADALDWSVCTLREAVTPLLGWKEAARV